MLKKNLITVVRSLTFSVIWSFSIDLKATSEPPKQHLPEKTDPIFIVPQIVEQLIAKIESSNRHAESLKLYLEMLGIK